LADIFLSYASVDVDRARHLAEVLQQYGSVFWDRTIPTGKTWRQHIGAELESARCLVVAWSEASVESSWVQEEVDDARERATPIFPVFFDGVRAPLGFRSIQGRNLSDWDYTNTFPALQLFLTDVAAFLHSDPSVGRDQGDTDKTHSSPQGDASPPADTTKETLFDRFQSRVEAIPVLRTPLIQALFGGVIFLSEVL